VHVHVHTRSCCNVFVCTWYKHVCTMFRYLCKVLPYPSPVQVGRFQMLDSERLASDFKFQARPHTNHAVSRLHDDPAASAARSATPAHLRDDPAAHSAMTAHLQTCTTTLPPQQPALQRPHPHDHPAASAGRSDTTAAPGAPAKRPHRLCRLLRTDLTPAQLPHSLRRPLSNSSTPA
jgi:hypothetical protein